MNTNTTANTAHACLCGCGLPITTKALFKPGHDAKMVSNLVAVVVADNLSKAGIAKLAKTLPSDALRRKFENAAARAIAPKPAKQTGDEEVAA